jgi:8-oxo-dGTP pyrophosphatase MutT (NUDIX family)
VVARRLPIKDALSAGGVVWRRGPGDDIEVVLCGRLSDSLWVLPKGTPDPGESGLETALREVREETGLLVRETGELMPIEYWFTSGGIRFHKRVLHWLMEPVGGSTNDHDREFDLVEWLPIDDALKRMSYPYERRVVEEAKYVLEARA